ncbi:MAG: hypothetical protein COA78_23485 [Blastopirellula sp.]|nr:MAG: hypothetical protein COA78_23485 [Blastopirellula sp.]
MWFRNILFLGICGLLLSTVAASLLIPEMPLQVSGHNPVAFQQPEFRGIVEKIDAQFQTTWEDEKLEPAPIADDLQIARRLSLGLTGKIPSVEDIRLIEKQPESQRIQWWISKLFEDRRYADFVAERLARAYVGTENGPFLVYRGRRFKLWLSDQLYDNRPYDELVQDLIAERGIWTDEPAVNFITASMGKEEGENQPDPVKLAARVTRAFLGTRMDCVECHDDNLGGDLLQSDFHEMASFFRGTENSFTGITDNQKKDYNYKYLYAEEEVVVPSMVPFNKELLQEQGTERERLANWVTHPENRPFARAIVNRIWAIMTSRPLVEPVDSIPIDGTYEDGTFPPGLDLLADDFIEHDFDVQRLIRVIAETTAFQTDSQADHEITAAHEQHWAAFPVTRLRPEQVVGSVIQSASLQALDTDSHIIAKLMAFGQQQDFIKRYGDSGEDEFAIQGGTIPQRLLMMNGKLVKERTSNNPLFNAASRIAMFSPDDETAIETAFLATLTRRPTTEETAYFINRLENADESVSRTDQFEDIYWSLLNCTEFAWNH